MSPDDGNSAYRREMLLASTMIAAGSVLVGVAVVQIMGSRSEGTQVTHPLQSSPPAPNNTPVEAKPGGTRPTTPGPEPARPDPKAQQDGEKPALPLAPAEKVPPPIKDH